MKKIFCFLLIFVFALVLCSCNNYETEDKTSSINTSENFSEPEIKKTSILYGITSPDPETRLLVYNGEPINISFKAENGTTKAEWGLRMFVDGYLQTFCVEDKEYDLYCFELDSEEKINFDLSFTPIVGNAGKESTVNFILYLNPNYILEDKDYVGYGSNHKITQLLPWKLIINSNIEKNIIQNSVCQTFLDIPSEITNDLSNQLDENQQTINYLDISTFIKHFQSENNYNTVKIQDSKMKTYIQGYGKSEKYRLSLYVNHTLVNAFDGNPYCIFEVKENMLTQIETNLTYDFINDNNFAYIIAVPISEKYNLYASDVEKTISMKIILE